MSEKTDSPEKDIELRHSNAMEEIMGQPPSVLIALGSGVILLLVALVFSASALVTYPDSFQSVARIHGTKPLSVLIAGQSGEIEGTLPDSWSPVSRGATVFQLKNTDADSVSEVVSDFSGRLETNPLLTVNKSVGKGDTLGFVWGELPERVVCTIDVPAEYERNVNRGNKIRLFVGGNGAESVIETEAKVVNNFNTGGKRQIVAELPGDLFLPEQRKLMTDGGLKITAEIVTGEQSLFNRLINPFRGLLKN